VADQAQHLASVECFKKIEYPLAPQVAAALAAEAADRGAEASGSLQRAHNELQSATAAAASGAPDGGVVSAFANPSLQGSGSANLQTARDLLGKACFLHTSR